MVQSDTPHRRRAVYAQLKAIADDPQPLADERDATEYNRLVDQLTELGYEAEEFKIHDDDMERPVMSFNSITGEKRYGERALIHPRVLHRKVTALLTFMDLANDATVVDINLPRRPSER